MSAKGNLVPPASPPLRRISSKVIGCGDKRSTVRHLITAVERLTLNHSYR